jgi:hypothetical protein
LSRVGASHDETLGFRGAFDRATEHQCLDLVVKEAPGALAAARKPRWHLAQHDHDRIRTSMIEDELK